MATNVPVTLDTLIVIKVLFQGHNKKFKVPLRDLGINVLPSKVRRGRCRSLEQASDKPETPVVEP